MNALHLRWEAWRLRRIEKRALFVFGTTLATPEHDAKVARLEEKAARSGVVDRVVFHVLAFKARRERDAARIERAEAALDGASGLVAEAARAARKAAVDAAAAVTPLPPAVREAQHLGQYLVKETNARLIPRVPALVGLAVGYAIAQTFTDSQFSATLHSWGLGDGPRHAVRSETLRAMNFWLPLVAAAVTSYAGSRLAALVKRRYETTSAAE